MRQPLAQDGLKRFSLRGNGARLRFPVDVHPDGEIGRYALKRFPRFGELAIFHCFSLNAQLQISSMLISQPEGQAPFECALRE